MNSILHFGYFSDPSFAQTLSQWIENRKVMILVDENTNPNCLPHLFMHVDGLDGAEIVELPSGEDNKQMEYCLPVWETLTECRFTRTDLLIVVGGGVLCDMGGLIAGLYKRGLACIYIPTTLLSMVDASVGGKTAVDLGPYKNQIGLFCHPKAVYIDSSFLETLTEKEKRNGLAEMAKHALIKGDWDLFKKWLAPSFIDDLELTDIEQSVRMKEDVVAQDPEEKHLRKVLNLGHTVAHAIEGYCLNHDAIDHGVAVAHGLTVEALIAVELGLIDSEKYTELKSSLENHFSWRQFSEQALGEMIELMAHDKKNNSTTPLFVLLSAEHKFQIDVEVPREVIEKCMKTVLLKA